MNADMLAKWGRLKSLLKFEGLAILLVALGMVLRLRQYIANRSLWHDEANLALNLANRTFAGLMQPLDFDQGAPLGFLFIEKFFITVLGNKDYILRLLPLLSGLFAVYLIYRIAREYFRVGGLLAILVFVISWSLIYYSSELKQYSGDAMFVLLLVYLVLRCLEENARLRDFFLLGVVGLISIWLSHPAAFVLVGIGLALFFVKLIRPNYRQFLWVLGVGVAWAVSFGTSYLISLRYLIMDSSLQNFWRHAFMPRPIWHHWDWLTQIYFTLLGTAGAGLDNWYLALICSLLIVIGIISLLVRNRNILIITISPFFVALVASALQKYPLTGRFLLFLIPLLILLMAEGVGGIYTIIGKWDRRLALAACLVVTLVIVWVPTNSISSNFLSPPMGDDVKPVMNYVEQHRTQNDIIYVYHGARPSFNYYAPIYGFNTGNVISGLDLGNIPALQQFYKQVDRLKGNERVWVIFSHVVDCGGCVGHMQDFYVQYLNQFGKIEAHFATQGADVYLYNLTSP